MPTQDFVMKQGMTFPSLTAVLMDGAGHSVDLTDANQVIVRLRDSLTNAMALEAPALVLPAEEGPEAFPCTVAYDWPEPQALPAAVYNGEWEVIWQDGNIESFPNDGYFLVKIIASLDDEA